VANLTLLKERVSCKNCSVQSDGFSVSQLFQILDRWMPFKSLPEEIPSRSQVVPLEVVKWIIEVESADHRCNGNILLILLWLFSLPFSQGLVSHRTRRWANGVTS